MQIKTELQSSESKQSKVAKLQNVSPEQSFEYSFDQSFKIDLQSEATKLSNRAEKQNKGAEQRSRAEEQSRGAEQSSRAYQINQSRAPGHIRLIRAELRLELRSKQRNRTSIKAKEQSFELNQSKECKTLELAKLQRLKSLIDKAKLANQSRSSDSASNSALDSAPDRAADRVANRAPDRTPEQSL